MYDFIEQNIIKITNRSSSIIYYLVACKIQPVIVDSVRECSYTNVRVSNFKRRLARNRKKVRYYKKREIPQEETREYLNISTERHTMERSLFTATYVYII